MSCSGVIAQSFSSSSDTNDTNDGYQKIRGHRKQKFHCIDAKLQACINSLSPYLYLSYF